MTLVTTPEMRSSLIRRCAEISAALSEKPAFDGDVDRYSETIKLRASVTQFTAALARFLEEPTNLSGADSMGPQFGLTAVILVEHLAGYELKEISLNSLNSNNPSTKFIGQAIGREWENETTGAKEILVAYK